MQYISFRKHGRPSIDAVDSLVMQQALLAYSMMAATVPCLRGFLGRFQTGDLAKLTESEIMQSDDLREMGSRSKTRPHGQSYTLSLMDRQRLGKVRQAKNQLSTMLQSDSQRQSTYAGAKKRDNYGSGSGSGSGDPLNTGNERLIIHHTKDFDVVAHSATDE